MDFFTRAKRTASFKLSKAKKQDNPRLVLGRSKSLRSKRTTYSPDFSDEPNIAEVSISYIDNSTKISTDKCFEEQRKLSVYDNLKYVHASSNVPINLPMNDVNADAAAIIMELINKLTHQRINILLALDAFMREDIDLINKATGRLKDKRLRTRSNITNPIRRSRSLDSVLK
ncbi:hypothetical protein DP163_gp009 [Sea otter poxvirus]|uniref:Uncharacterized protein n=1 Tax=Sea otter poxvirus TaxID=1416741 RepID=A0A2U9QHH6_9POXV|nr:hypothetical protein DP163_gp009 [Sea otter poxvirus]AWU47054.1 hypothetical protein [Sea otter poxvirus]